MMCPYVSDTTCGCEKNCADGDIRRNVPKTSRVTFILVSSSLTLRVCFISDSNAQHDWDVNENFALVANRLCTCSVRDTCKERVWGVLIRSRRRLFHPACRTLIWWWPLPRICADDGELKTITHTNHDIVSESLSWDVEELTSFLSDELMTRKWLTSKKLEL